jgi:16S rRNA processing protein RimM
MEMESNRETPLPEREYAHAQIIGLRVITTRGDLIGTISDIITGQSNDNYVVRGDKGEILIPAIEDVVQSINLDEGYITIEAIDGLLDLNKKKPSD